MLNVTLTSVLDSINKRGKDWHYSHWNQVQLPAPNCFEVLNLCKNRYFHGDSQDATRRRGWHFGSRKEKLGGEEGDSSGIQILSPCTLRRKMKEGGKQHETFSGYERSSQGVLEYESTSAHHCFYLQKERKWSPVISNTLFRRGRCRQSRNAALKLSVYFWYRNIWKRLTWVLERHQKVPLQIAAFITNLQLIILIFILPEQFWQLHKGLFF